MSKLVTRCSPLATPRCYSLLTTSYLLLVTHYSSLTTRNSLLVTHYSLLTTRDSLLVTALQRSGSFRILDGAPLPLHGVEIGPLKGKAPRGEAAFELGEAPRELGVRPPEGRFGLDAELAREVGDREEQVAHLLLGAPSGDAARGDGPAQLADLLLD